MTYQLPTDFLEVLNGSRVRNGMGQSSRDTSSNVRRENTQSESQQQQNASAAPEYTSQQKEAVDKYVLISVVTGLGQCH